MQPKLKEKRWKKEFEVEIFNSWERKKLYKFDKNDIKNVFVIDTPPPTANSKWHVGGASGYSQIDMIARTARMQGFNVLFPWCSDRNGLPMEVSVEKAHNIKMYDTPREEFIKLCSNWAIGIHNELTVIAKRLGFSCEYSGDFYYETDKPYYRRLTQETFIELWNKGLVYVDGKPNNYCPKCRTTIADAEVEYVDLPTTLIYLNFKIKNSHKKINIATTRPELLGACAAVLYNPNDERYKDLKGKKAIIPIYNLEVPIIAHPYAKMEFGSGLVMICSYGDYADVRMFRELKLKPTSMIDEEGKMNENSGDYKGHSIPEARKKIIEDLKNEDYVTKIETIQHRTPVCWRSKDPIELVSMQEYYLNQIKFVPDLKRIVKNLKFHPESHRQILLDWVNAVSQDWVISRRRYYGTEIPIWYCKKCNEAWLPKPGEYYQPWKNPPPKYAKCKCGSKEFVGEERTFDTWMDSSISELFVTGYKRFPTFFKKAFPCALRPQGKDIIRSWLYYTLLRAYQLFKKPAFIHAWTSGHGVDEHGKKMSKSIGNVVDPIPIIEEYGADAFRFYGAAETSLGNDWRYSKEKIEAAQKFLTKIWNISRFISMFEAEGKVDLAKTDKWILGELNKAITKCKKGYKDFNFFVPANETKHFLWTIFADHYIEMVKSRAYNKDKLFKKTEQNAAIKTLHTCLKTILKELAPICPFVTEKIWIELYSTKSIHFKEFPKKIKEGDEKLTKLTEKLIKFNSWIWKQKKDAGLSLNSELEVIFAPKELKMFENDLKAMHNIKVLNFE